MVMEDLSDDEAGLSGEDAERVRGFISSGSEATGAAVGGAIGLLLGPPGAVVGAAGGVLIAKTLERGALEIHDRVLTERQQRRSADAFITATGEIQERLKDGESLRDDGFFDQTDESDSDAAEILEGALLKAADTYEQKKVEYLGRFFSHLVFRPEVSKHDAVFLMELLDRLTYGQVVMLAIFGRSVDFRLDEVMARISDGEFEPASLALELADLGERGLFGYPQEKGDPMPPQHTWSYDPYDIDVSKLRLTPIGRLLFELLGLDEMPDEEMRPVARNL